MKILQVNKFYYPKGGSETYYFSLCQLLAQNGHQIVHFAMQDSRNFVSPFQKYFVSHLDISQPQSSFSALKQIPRLIWSQEAARKLETLIVKEKPEIVHLHNIDRHLTPAIIPILRKYQIPIVMTLHDYKILCPNSILFAKGKICEKCKNKKFFHPILEKCVKNSLKISAVASLEAYYHSWKGVWNQVDLYLAPSQFMKDKMVEFGYSKSKIAHLPLFIEELKNHRIKEIKKQKYFLYFGRLSPEKGLITLIKAFSHFPQEKLKIAGSGPQEGYLRTIARGNQNIEFLGFQEKNPMFELIRQAKAVIIPSIWYENAPYSVIEAMDLGKVVIASRIGGIPELIEDKKTGLLFNPGDEKDLQDKINKVLDGGKTFKEIEKNAAQKVKNDLNPEIHYQKLYQIYQSLV